MVNEKTQVKLTSSKWSTLNSEGDQGQLYIAGAVFASNARLSFLTLREMLSLDERWRDALSRLNGFFALILQREGQLLAAVDRVRSIPLFYGMVDRAVFVSDDAEWIREQVGDTEMDPVAREEFIQAGYVTGPDTLYKNVRQLQAGELLIIDFNGLETAVRTDRYYLLSHFEPATYDEFALRLAFSCVVEGAMRRLIEYAGGRKILIPLSGGYDSRLIATWLKKLGYRNVLTFSYGVPDNYEAKYSQTVANALGFPWRFVEYSNALWAEEWGGSDAEEFRKRASGHCSLPCIQDWLAIKQMLAEGNIDSDCVVVPGHTGDFISGGHIPDIVFLKPDLSKNDLVDVIQKKHLFNSPIGKDSSRYSTDWNDRILSRIHLAFNGDSPNFAALYEQWEWQERQAKYIVNSVRVYDFFGLNWWMPLWDTEFMKFWEKVPLVLRRERKWYKDLVSELFHFEANQGGRIALMGNATDNQKENKVISWIRKMSWRLPHLVRAPVRNIYRNLYHPERQYDKHFLAFGGLIERAMLYDYLLSGYSIIGIYSILYINGTWGKNLTAETSGWSHADENHT